VARLGECVDDISVYSTTWSGKTAFIHATYLQADLASNGAGSPANGIVGQLWLG